jgi:hypothetical protein
MTIGWVHLAFFVVCQSLFSWGARSAPLFVLIWALEVVAIAAVMRRILGRGWLRESSGTALVARIWITYLILAFNLASLNHLTGWTVDWFKPAWCTLASFGFASLAWLFGLRYLVWAVQMYFTGLLMVQFPAWNYLIQALSWWVVLEATGLGFERQRVRWLTRNRTLSAPAEPAGEPVVKAEPVQAEVMSGA